MYISGLLALALCASEAQAIKIPVERKQVDSAFIRPHAPFAKRQSGIEPNAEHNDHYWFGKYNVGDSKNLDLLIDTGSPFVLVNPGLYKPSKNAKQVAPSKRNFNLTYEGVNKAGTGFETVYTKVSRDTVSAGELSVLEQGIGNITHYNTSGTAPLPNALPGDGIIGFSYVANDTHLGTPLFPTWVSNLCHKKSISECRFGLAYGTNDKGVQVVGEVAKDLFKEKELTTTPVLTASEFPGWTIAGDVSLNGKLHFPNQTLIMDCGTNNMQAPLPAARKIFKELGYQTVTTEGGPNPFDSSFNVSFITAYYPCDNPPTLSFSFPAGKTKVQKTFNLLKSEWQFEKKSANNCTAVLVGTNALSDPDTGFQAWLIGQPFYQGHYVDHQLSDPPGIGFATLKNPGNVAGSG